MTSPALWQAGSPRSLAFGARHGGCSCSTSTLRPARCGRPCARRCACSSPARPRHEIVYWNAGYSVPRAIRRLDVDAVVLDNTLLVARWAPEFAARRPTFDWLAGVDALKIAFPQDEYNHAHVLDDWLADLGIDVVFSVFGPEHRELLYPRLGATRPLRAVPARATSTRSTSPATRPSCCLTTAAGSTSRTARRP